MCTAIFPQESSYCLLTTGEIWSLLCYQRQPLLHNHPTFFLCFNFSNFKCKGEWCKFLWISSHGRLLFKTTLQQLKNNFSYAALSSQQDQKHEIMDLWTSIIFSLLTWVGLRLRKPEVRHWLRTPHMALLLLLYYTWFLGRTVLLIQHSGQIV